MTETTNPTLIEIDGVIRSSLSSLVEDISSSGWTGRREHEVVNLYCFGHLLRECRPNAFLRDVTQIGIEVGVPQVAGQVARTGRLSKRKKTIRSKKLVCKDLVIWPLPRMTCWDADGNPTMRPTSIIEWKYNQGDVFAYDVDWLREFSAGAEDFVGYAVSTNHGRAHNFRLSCTRIYRGEAQSEWLFIK